MRYSSLILSLSILAVTIGVILASPSGDPLVLS